MKFSTTLLVAGALALGATSAQAYDLDHPFYTPGKGKLTSTTSYQYNKKDTKVEDTGMNGRYHGQGLAESLAYGLSNDWTLYGGLDKAWDKYKVKGDNDGSNHGKHAYYTLGTSYNFINDGRAFAQAGVLYRQSFEENGHGKIGTIIGRAGYDLGAFTPFANLAITRPLNQGHDNHTTYDLLLAGYKKLTRRTSAVLGLDLSHTKDRTKDKAATLIGEYNYLLQQNLNLKLTAAYLLKNTAASTEGRVTKGYSVGAAVQYEF